MTARGHLVTWRSFLIAVFGYVVLLTLLATGLQQARSWAVGDLDTYGARADWQTFRDDVVRQSKVGGPVHRRVPKSVEPPALVLMRDHFTSCATIAVVLSTALYATTLFFLVGTLRAQSRQTDPS